MIRPEAMITYYIVILIILAIPYVIGSVYISVVWHLARVVSVLEETYGLKAMKKSKTLIKGKIWIASAIFVMFQILISVLLMVFNMLVVHGESIGMVGRVSLGIFCFLLLTILIHFALVTQTIIYFVCKSYHDENIDKS
ncbi:hypothetical protein BVC80_1801g4 [Macleaya cordata]|uniref:Uncharacterized protein n=1 Tax=Macleaya cordata TaxID=56857 RepID=A0A200PMK6_MACCD|nr:hypothetical protein BVC80_1801g4 [Macleaya cordata]